jgi:release factor glutamine methyltransferase
MLLGDIIGHAAKQFEKVGIDSAVADAELLAGHVLGLSRGGVQAACISRVEISAEEADLIFINYGRRQAREPLQHIIGVAYFRNLELNVGSGVFIPRPETEFVAQLAINELLALDSPITVDLGTGSGAIALSIATEVPGCKVFAVEKSPEAIVFTQKNFEKYAGSNAQLSAGDLSDCFPELNGKVSLVVSNPPYIPEQAIPRDPEVRLFDPALALYGGTDGMSVMHKVSATARRLLVPGGRLVVEHADSQGLQVCQLLLADGFSQVQSHQDLTGRDRAVSATK